jgi:hypothetical protein
VDRGSQCATSALGVIGKACATAQEMGAGPPEAACRSRPQILKLRWLRARVVSVKEKSWLKTVAGEVLGDEHNRTIDEVSKQMRRRRNWGLS